MEPELFRDAAGRPRARLYGSRRLLARFLEDELGESLPATGSVLAAVAAVRAGGIYSWLRPGRLETLRITPFSVAIEPEDDLSLAPCRLSLDDFAAYLERWRRLVAEGGEGTGGPPRGRPASDEP